MLTFTEKGITGLVIPTSQELAETLTLEAVYQLYKELGLVFVVNCGKLDALFLDAHN